jgi:hypothetical protein
MTSRLSAVDDGEEVHKDWKKYCHLTRCSFEGDMRFTFPLPLSEPPSSTQINLAIHEECAQWILRAKAFVLLVR